ncbi:Sugar transferase involved in LPS biosynthesis (colanic, teichoic acid) [Paenimyroides aquimaris]|uniref:Sugar transferase involved in LPS biosynthesis (Colanic, teichoic acid) n=1 Tax=Paenimyroides marinum TaxID=1159016 RepID=A0A1H6J6F4_9FLAO|nr:sugar transferase [Paenimyroides aquimaris]SEH57703.1 Sugar transferase involved in LPS biosynthesis (colanic, teichoic acid) [Paenimyroides aquimaris]
MYKNYIKRIIDFFAAFFGLLLLSPVFIIVMIGLFFANQGKPFFFQERPGLNEKIFKIIKFKSMNDKKDKEGNLLPDAERLTPMGAFVRKTSLDEIPQLINVLKGDMSLIGPRPLLVRYLPYYTEREKLRHTVKPGITGLAQVNGRNFLMWDDRLELDAKYVENISFSNDLKILLLTIKGVIKRDNIEIIPSKLGTTLDKYRSLK